MSETREKKRPWESWANTREQIKLAATAEGYGCTNTLILSDEDYTLAFVKAKSQALSAPAPSKAVGSPDAFIGRANECVDMKDVVLRHSFPDLLAALREPLPFQIPVLEGELVRQYPQTFTFSDSNIDIPIRHFLQSPVVGRSVMSTVIIDGCWLDILQGCVIRMNVQHNQGGASRDGVRPDTYVEVSGALAVWNEARFDTDDLIKAFSELPLKFRGDAYKIFPKGHDTIVGLTTALGKIRMNLISYDPGTGSYTATWHRDFQVSAERERINFLVDLMRVARWMASIDSNCYPGFHLTLGIRRKTPNCHHITWDGREIIKEFDKKVDMTAALELMHDVYSHRPPLLHVEHGRVIDRTHRSQRIAITRVGYEVTMATMERFGLTAKDVISHVEKGLEELHSMGLAHCDISVKNTAIDDSGIVFLNDLEYLTRASAPPPHLTRLPHGTTAEEVPTARILDDLQFQTFKSDVPWR